MGDDTADLVFAKYAFMGPGVELDRTLPLEDSERAIISGRVWTVYDQDALPAARSGFLRLSTERLCVVRCYKVTRDRIVEIPRAAVVRVEVNERLLHVRYRPGLGPRNQPPAVRIRFRGLTGEEEIGVLMAAEVGVGDPRGTVKQSAADMLALGGELIAEEQAFGLPGAYLARGGILESLEGIARALQAWAATGGDRNATGLASPRARASGAGGAVSGDATGPPDLFSPPPARD